MKIYSSARKVAYNPKTFEQFLEIIMEGAMKYGIEGLHTHWRPISLLCFPCKVKYEFYGDATNIGSELPHFVQTLTQGQLTLNNVKSDKKQVGNTDTTAKLCSSVQNRTLIRKISEFYKVDYEMFGYEYPDPMTL